MLRSLVIVLAACGGNPSTPTPKPAPHIAITSPRPGMTMRYRTCSDRGHVSLETTGASATSWVTSPASEQDRGLAVDGRIHADPLAWVARRGDLIVRATGMTRTALAEDLSRIDTTTATRHVVDGHRLPWAGAFDGVTFESPGAVYVARFVHYSVFGGMKETPTTTIAGAPFRWGRSDQPTNDDGDGPLIPSWHGEVFLGRLVLTIDAQGHQADEKTFLAFASQTLRAALADPDPACRDRPGRWSAGFKRSPSDAVQMIGSELVVERTNQRIELSVGDDGTVRANRRPIGQITVNGYVMRWVRGTPEILGVVDARNQFTYEASKQVVSIDLTTADRAGYRGDPAGRLLAALALLLI